MTTEAKKTKKALREELADLVSDAYSMSVNDFRTRAEQIEDLSSRTYGGRTLLAEVAGNMLLEKTRILLELGVPVDGDAFNAVASGSSGHKHALAVFDALADAGPDPNFRDRWGQTALFHAAVTNNWRPRDRERVVKRLLDLGADPNLGDKSGVAPLHLATRKNKKSIVMILLDGGADPLAVTTGSYDHKWVDKGESPMAIAKKHGCDEILEILEQRAS